MAPVPTIQPKRNRRRDVPHAAAELRSRGPRPTLTVTTYQDALRLLGKMLDLESPPPPRVVIDEDDSSALVRVTTGYRTLVITPDEVRDAFYENLAQRGTGIGSPGPLSSLLRTIGIGLDSVEASGVRIDVQPEVIRIHYFTPESPTQPLEVTYEGRSLATLLTDAEARRGPTGGGLRVRRTREKRARLVDVEVP